MKHLTYIFFLIMGIRLTIAQPSDQSIAALVNEVEPEVIEWRHWFHQHAELSNREFKTAEKITEILTTIGYKPSTGIAKTGVVALLEGGKPGPVVALRADMDGLPVLERVPLEWASKQVGEYNGEKVPVMHACGHDTHVSILLGVAKMLWEVQDEVAGTVKFIFQPAEEGAPEGEEGGAKLMVEEGVLQNPKVDAIFGLHINSQTPVGTLKVRPEGILAAVNSIRIDVKGKQAHGSAPWDGIDPIVTASQIVNNLQSIVSRNMQLTKAPAVVTIGAIHGGVRSNIIPEEVYMLGTVRTLDKDMRTQVLKRIEEVVESTAASNNAEATVSIDEGYPVTYNEVNLYESMLPTLQRVAGKENVEIIRPITGAEDFSFYQEKVPGLFFFVGGCPKGTDPSTVAGHHTPDFYVDDAGMALGMRAMMSLTLDYLEKN